ncbi:MAG TPA: sulfotransferase [Verrucomicrobiae bacterium]|jgi:hypothetical protein|nr:sulfotransferase [Verrucomicrobiae bacterium]
MSAESSIAMTAPAEKSHSTEATNLGYILAASYSGSTLLAMLLGSQRDAITVGEMRAPSLDEPDSYLCSCGEPIKGCKFWSEVSAGMARRGIADFDITNAQLSIHDAKNPFLHRLLEPLPRGPLLETARSTALAVSPSWPAHLQNVHHRNGALVEVLREITGTKVVIDSSKIALHLKFLLKAPKLKIKVIWLVRDGRAVTTSMLGHGMKQGSRQETVAAAALSWKRNNEAGERVLQEMPKSQWMFLQYEALCRQPEETLRGLCKFLGMDTRQIVLDFRAKQQHILGNDMRLKSGSEIRLDERWRTALTPEDLGTFNEVAGGSNRKYGYE